MMREYEVTLPITGLAYLTVQAESEEAVIEAALGMVTRDDIQEWERAPRLLGPI